GRALLIERLSVHAIWKTLHDERAIFYHRQQKRRDAHVIAHQLALGNLQFRPEQLPQVADIEPLIARQVENAGAGAMLDRFELVDEILESSIGDWRTS